jgi:hypothetical protein
MPRVSEFFGIAIYLYWHDQGRHSMPHFHAFYGEHQAVFSIPDAELIAGSFPRKQARIVQAWAAIRESELERAWERAVNAEDPGRIAPIR